MSEKVNKARKCPICSSIMGIINTRMLDATVYHCPKHGRILYSWRGRSWYKDSKLIEEQRQ